MWSTTSLRRSNRALLDHHCVRAQSSERSSRPTVQGIAGKFEGSRFRLMFCQTGWGDGVSPDLIESIVPFRPAGVVLAGVESDKQTSRPPDGFRHSRGRGRRALRTPSICWCRLHPSKPAGLWASISARAGSDRCLLRAHPRPRGRAPARLPRRARAAWSRTGCDPADRGQPVVRGRRDLDPRDPAAPAPSAAPSSTARDVLAFGALMEAQSMNITVPGRTRHCRLR